MRTLEAYYRLRIAQGDEFVRPDACVGFGIVDETGIAVCLMRLTVDAFDVTGAASVTIRVHTELIFAARAADRRICNKKIIDMSFRNGLNVSFDRKEKSCFKNFAEIFSIY